MSQSNNVFSLVVLGIVLAGFGWFVEVKGVQVLVRQYRAQTCYARTEGEVNASVVSQHTSSKGQVSYSPSFIYTYSVNGTSYRGRTYRYGTSVGGWAAANLAVSAHPTGSTVDVYYDPQNPADACLAPMVVPQDVATLLLFSPVLMLIMFLVYKTGAEVAWRSSGQPVAGGLKLITAGRTTRVRLPRCEAGSLGWLTAGVFIFISGVLIAFVLNFPPVAESLWAVGMSVVSGFAVYLWQRGRLASGIQDLVIDEGARTVELPLTYKRTERQPLPFTEIVGVTLVAVEHRNRRGVSYTYAPTLRMRDGSPERLGDLSESRATSFAEWLCEKLEVPLR